jgi:abortive infection bacteriophage resistance protein
MNDVLVLKAVVLIEERVFKHTVLEEVSHYRLKELLALQSFGNGILDHSFLQILSFELFFGCFYVGICLRNELLLFNLAI